jgi:hypothetical protein
LILDETLPPTKMSSDLLFGARFVIGSMHTWAFVSRKLGFHIYEHNFLSPHSFIIKLSSWSMKDTSNISTGSHANLYPILSPFNKPMFLVGHGKKPKHMREKRKKIKRSDVFPKVSSNFNRIRISFWGNMATEVCFTQRWWS